MSRPRDFRQIVWLMGLLVLLSGCRETPSSDASQEARSWSNSGKRMTLNDADGRVLFKVRKRRNSIRVYDDSLRFVGRVHLKDGEVTVEAFPSGAVVPVTKNGIVVEAEGYFRIEKMAVGWTIFDGKSHFVGYVAQEGERWNFREDWGGEPTMFAETVPGKDGAIIMKGSTLTATSHHFSAAMSLIGSLKGLSPLARAGLGLWLQTFGEASEVRLPQPEDAQN